jgi:hypothetical protein
MPSSSATAAAGSRRSAAAMFSRRWAVEEVPGISATAGERCNSQASATCCVEASSRAATETSASACNGEKPPSGKNGT